MTGAQLPAGADAVVPVEWTDGGVAAVEIYRPAAAGANVRYAGGDAVAGETLLTAGTRMRPDARRGGRVGRAQAWSRSARGRGWWCSRPGTS